jgi:hypothetical protein
MMCFIEERYAKGLASGGMLGYVFDRDVEQARARVAAAIVANRPKLRSFSLLGLDPSCVIAGDRRVTESVHTLARRNFTIYHLFVAV